MKMLFNFPLKRIALTAIIAILVFLPAKFAWDEWTFYVLAVSILYFLGGFRFFPTRTVLQKTISFGLFCGMTFALLYFVTKTGT
jgi:hypothetical protein